VAQSLAQHLNRVLNLTVTDSPLFVEPITDHDGDAFELTGHLGRRDGPAGFDN